MKYLFTFLAVPIVGWYTLSSTYAYTLGLKSRDNSIRNIERTEKKADISSPIVSFIFDPRETTAYQTVADLPYTLGKQRIYHITVSPGNLTAKEVADWWADDQYTEFFTLVKSLWLRVVFRTMHEMNGGWYPRSSDPKNFAKARQHVRQLSRDAWLTKENILFDMSVNGRDMPTRDALPSQESRLMYCYPSQKTSLHCPTFEDYYPGDNYVDVMGFTFYNRGKGNANRLWQSPYEIIMHPQRKTLERIKRLQKPLFIDEVGTTSIRYDDAYSQEASQLRFGQRASIARKNIWLGQLRDMLLNEKNIIGAIYFNVDLTYGLSNWQIGEADRSIIDPSTNMIYSGGVDLFTQAKDNVALQSPLLDTFDARRIPWWNTTRIISKRYWKNALALLTSLHIDATTPIKDRKTAFDWYAKRTNETQMKSSSRTKILRILQEAKQIVE
jgi:hypothetical protein